MVKVKKDPKREERIALERWLMPMAQESERWVGFIICKIKCSFPSRQNVWQRASSSGKKVEK
jgi:hypothetical protein